MSTQMLFDQANKRIMVDATLMRGEVAEGLCPNCGKELSEPDKPEKCPGCGLPIIWYVVRPGSGSYSGGVSGGR